MCKEMRSVSLVYARLRGAQRINGLPQAQKPEGIYVMDANVPGELDSRYWLDRCDFAQ
jgi:hypothetical protein